MGGESMEWKNWEMAEINTDNLQKGTIHDREHKQFRTLQQKFKAFLCFKIRQMSIKEEKEL